MAMWRYVSRISTDVPDGWDVLETTELRGPDGIHLRLTAQPADGELTSDALAERHRQLLEAELEGCQQGPTVSREGFGGQPTLRRMFEWQEGERVGRSVTDYLVSGGMAYLAAATGPKEALERHATMVDAVLDSVVALGGPLKGIVASDVPDDSSRPPSDPGNDTPSRRSPVDEGTWRALAESWASADLGSTGGPELALSLEELLVVAATMGVGVFPTVDPAPYAALTLPERSAISRAVARGLRLRGFLEGADEAPQPSAELASLLQVTLFPDLLTELHVVDGATSRPVDMVAFAVRPDAMVVTRTAGPFGRTLTEVPPDQLVATLTSEVEGAMADGDVSVRVRSTWRDRIGILASDLTWSEADTEDAVRAELLANLPGAVQPTSVP